jgi:hypothetical protein
MVKVLYADFYQFYSHLCSKQLILQKEIENYLKTSICETLAMRILRLNSMVLDFTHTHDTDTIAEFVPVCLCVTFCSCINILVDCQHSCRELVHINSLP